MSITTADLKAIHTIGRYVAVKFVRHKIAKSILKNYNMSFTRTAIRATAIEVHDATT